MDFKEFLATNLCTHWITLQVGSFLELLISAYFNPCIKDFCLCGRRQALKMSGKSHKQDIGCQCDTQAASTTYKQK